MGKVDALLRVIRELARKIYVANMRLIGRIYTANLLEIEQYNGYVT